jgi:uncharacterized OB-fold protein
VTQLLEPPVSDAAAPFWDATREQQLVLPWCSECDRVVWYPREICPACASSSIDWRPASGRGEVYAVSVHHLPGPGRDPSELPYAVALVALPEGARLMSNVVNCEPDRVVVGMPVRVAWHPLSDGRHLPFFEPS